jgi:hypothetical protein
MNNLFQFYTTNDWASFSYTAIFPDTASGTDRIWNGDSKNIFRGPI